MKKKIYLHMKNIKEQKKKSLAKLKNNKNKIKKKNK